MQAAKTSACLAAKAVHMGTDSAVAQSLSAAEEDTPMASAQTLAPIAAMAAMCPSCGFANRLARVLGRCCCWTQSYESIYPSLAASRSCLLPSWSPHPCLVSGHSPKVSGSYLATSHSKKPVWLQRSFGDLPTIGRLSHCQEEGPSNVLCHRCERTCYNTVFGKATNKKENAKPGKPRPGNTKMHSRFYRAKIATGKNVIFARINDMIWNE